MALTKSGFFFISSCNFLYKSSHFATPFFFKQASHYENFFIYPSYDSVFNYFIYLSTWTAKILSLCFYASYFSVSPSLIYPGNLLVEWGIKIPPSTAPFKAPKTLFPVVVLVIPISKNAENGLLSFFSSATE